MFNPTNNYKKIYQAGKTVLMRNPLFPISDLLSFYENNIETTEFIKHFFSNPIAKEALYIGSPDLFVQLQLWLDNKLDKEDKKAKTELSLLKYIIRMSSRCTPFGLFATCSVAELSDTTNLELADTSEIERHSRLDMDYVCQAYTLLLKNNEFRNNLKFKPNNSLYLIGQNYRYVEYRFAGKGRSYHLVQLEYNNYLELILNLAKEGKIPSELAAAIVDEEITLDDATSYVNELILNQVISSEIEPNVTGLDFVHILIATLEKLNIELEILNALKLIRDNFNQSSKKSSLETYQSVPTILENIGLPLNLKTLIQVDSLRPTTHHTINKKVSDQILQSSTLISVLSASNRPNDSFGEFKNKFIERYESQFVPLVEVLDTESGIGYGKFSNQGMEESPLIADLPIGNGARGGGENNMPAIEEYKWELYEKSLLGNLKTIEIDEKLIEKFSKTEIDYTHLPDSVYGMVKIIANSAEDVDNDNYQLSMHGISGPSAASLWGRFCHLDSRIEQASNDFLREEEAHHSNAIYAEIVHLPESRIGNILMRPHLRAYEIPYLCNSILPEENQIQVSDLLVGIEGNRVVLKSKKLNKEIIPRMSNAHNFSMTSLPMYQFLCDLQYQLTLNFGWHWGGLESRKFLPRVTYGKTILSKARWILNKDEVSKLLKLNGEEFSTQFKALVIKRELPKFALFSQGDNELLMSLENYHCQKMIVEETNKYGQITLTESIETALQVTKDNNQKSYNAEFLIGFSKLLTDKKTISIEPKKEIKKEIVRNFAVGSEWLYVKVYCGSKTADNILSQVILPLCNELEEANKIEKFFFIRYTDPGHHIRLRFYNSNNTSFWAEILEKLKIALEPFLDLRLVSKIQNDTYQREIERYGYQTMDLSETIFHYQSKSILNFISLLSGDEGEVYRWQVGLRGVEMMLNDFKLSLPEKIEFVKANRNGFVAEFGLNTNQKKAISDKFYGAKQLISQLMEIDVDGEEDFQTGIKCFDIQDKKYHETTSEIIEILMQEDAEMSLNNILASFVHMFINRLFVSNQRAHEMVIYDYLMKYYEGKLAREKHSVNKPVKEEASL